MGQLKKLWAIIRKALVWLRLAKEIIEELDDFAKVELARVKASGLLESFAKIKNDLGAINTDLADLVSRSDDEIEILKRNFELRLAEIEKNKQAAIDEIKMNDAVSARLNEFVK
jgi:hypothetical protein